MVTYQSELSLTVGANHSIGYKCLTFGSSDLWHTAELDFLNIATETNVCS